MLMALESLHTLSALDSEGLLTELGRTMEPPLAKMLIASVELGCSEGILSVVAMLSMRIHTSKEHGEGTGCKVAVVGHHGSVCPAAVGPHSHQSSTGLK